MMEIIKYGCKVFSKGNYFINRILFIDHANNKQIMLRKIVHQA